MPTSAQINLAAKLWGLAVLSEIDSPGDPGSTFHDTIRPRSAKRARQRLEYLGLHPSDVDTEDKAVDVAMRLKP